MVTRLVALALLLGTSGSHSDSEARNSTLPRAGEVIQIVVCGETLKGRVGVVTIPQRKPHGDSTIHIYVDEI